jgi:hypothetical protein
MKGFSEQATRGKNGELKNSLAHPPYVATLLQDSLCGWNGAHGWHRAQIHRSKLEGAEPCAMLQKRFWVGMFVSKHVFFTFDFPQQPPQKHLGKSGPVTGQEDSPWKAPKPRSSGQARSCFGEVVGKTEGWVRKNGGINMFEPFYGDSMLGLLFLVFIVVVWNMDMDISPRI